MVQEGMRFAQLIMQQHCSPKLKVATTPPITDRDEQGFGSTGVQMARRNTSHLPIRQPIVEEVSEEDELKGWQDTTPKGKLEYWDESEPSPLVATDDDTESTTSEKDSWTEEEEPDDSWEIDLVALEDDDWEQTWMHQDDTPQSSHDAMLNPNTKTQTSIPMQTRAQNAADNLKADYF
eukprot:1515699-Ditylum_brightwellii.AAC.1